jgi:hypothetical protein
MHTGTSDDFVIGTGGNNDRLTITAAGAATFSSTVTIGSNLLAEDIKAKGSGGLTLQTDDGVKRIIIEDDGDVVINETGVSSDFRVESNNLASALFVDGGTGNVTMQGATTTIGSGLANTNVEFRLSGVDGKASRIKFSDGVTDRWLLGQGAASETTAFELYNSGGVIALSVDRTSNIATFGRKIQGWAATAGQYTFSSNNSAGSTGMYIINSNNQWSTAYNGGGSTGDTVMTVGKDGTTSRSINAGGTINASGSDYAEYMVKANDFTATKGSILGIDATGKLTDVYSDAVSFCVKTTDPAYVGGDTWSVSAGEKPAYDSPDYAAWESAFEAARATVDRVAFSGQVPVNITGATSGQYIIPINNSGSISGEAVTSPTFEQYKEAVGKVIAIEADGRARILVKII